MRQAGAVDLDDVDDDLEELEFSLSGQARLDAVRARADAMPVGEPGRAEYLTSLAEFLAMEDRLDDAEAAYREALEDGGPTLLHPLGGLLSVSLQRADDTAVNELNSRLWQPHGPISSATATTRASATCSSSTAACERPCAGTPCRYATSTRKRTSI